MQYWWILRLLGSQKTLGSQKSSGISKKLSGISKNLNLWIVRKYSTIVWIYGISKNTLGSQRSQKIFWDLKDLKKYFEILKISKKICRSQKISSDLEFFLNIWRKYSTKLFRSPRSQIYYRISKISKIHIQIESGRYLWTYTL